MRRRPRTDLERRLRRLEGDDPRRCVCTNPIRLAWPGHAADADCPECGGELIVVRLAWKPADPHRPREILAKHADRSGNLDLSRLSDDELEALAEAHRPPSERRGRKSR